MSYYIESAVHLLRRHGPAVARDIVFFTLLISAAAKLLDLTTFADALRSWTVLPSFTAPVVVLLVPSLELAVGLAGLLRLYRLIPVFAAALLLICFSSLYSLQLLLGEPPTCGCFGKLFMFQSGMAEARFSLVRNALLFCMLVPATLSAPCIRSRLLVASSTPRKSTRTAGFTLIELLVVMAIIALLIFQIAPTLSGVRSRARESVSLTNMRSHVGVFGVYTNDWRDTYPYFMIPDAQYTILRGGGAVVVLDDYFRGNTHWNVALADMYYEGNAFHESFYRPEYQGAVAGAGYDDAAVTYHYACCFTAHPDYWNPVKRTGPRQWTPTQADWVTHPSAKGLFVMRRDTDAGTVTDPSGWGVGFVDGSAGFFSQDQLLSGCRSGDGTPKGHIWPLYVYHTVDGVRGRDRR